MDRNTTPAQIVRMSQISNLKLSDFHLITSPFVEVGKSPLLEEEGQGEVIKL